MITLHWSVDMKVAKSISAKAVFVSRDPGYNKVLSPRSPGDVNDFTTFI